MDIIKDLPGLVQAWFDFIDNIGGVDNLNKHPVRRDRLRKLIKAYLDAYANPPEGVIGVGAITYAEQKLVEAQQGASSSLSSCLGGCAQHPFRGNIGEPK